MGKVECLGAYVNAPVVKINEDYYEDLNSQNLDKLIDNLKDNKNVKWVRNQREWDPNQER